MPADPSEPYAAARPEWYFLFLFQFLKVFEGWGRRGEFLGAIVVPGATLGVMFLMPILGQWKLGHRFNAVFTVAILAGAGLLTAMAIHEDYYALADRSAFADVEEMLESTGGDSEKIAAAMGHDEKKIADFENRRHKLEAIRRSEAFLSAVKQAGIDADRAIELAGRPEKIPPAGALSLVRSDPLTQGPRLFAQHCASCHAHVDPSAEGVEQVFAKSSAANLLNLEENLGCEDCLIQSRLLVRPISVTRRTVKATWFHLFQRISWTKTSGSKADKEAVVFALVEEAGLLKDTGNMKLVKRGRELIADTDRCGSCHPYRENETELGYAPDLNGWGSTEWVVGIITDPTHQRFYPDTNDRMPRFGVASEGGLPALTREQIELVSRWLRGSWYQPKGTDKAKGATDHPNEFYQGDQRFRINSDMIT